MTDAVKLPPMPEEGAGAMEVDAGPYTGPDAHLLHMQGAREVRYETAYSAAEMRAYAIQAVMQERERCAAICEFTHQLWEGTAGAADDAADRIRAQPEVS